MLARAWICGAVVVGACSSPPPSAASTTLASREPVEGEARDDGHGDPCAGAAAPERLTIDAGTWRTSATGLSIRYEGASHDSFEGGRTDLSLSLTLWVEGEPSQPWLPSALAPSRYEMFLGHCVRVVSGSTARAELDVAPLRRDRSIVAATPDACAADLEHLEDYALVADGRRYRVDVIRDVTTGAWEPTPLPRMPYHHASRLALRGLGDHPELATVGDRARLVIEMVSHTIEQVPGRREWRAEYVARVIDVCAEPR